MKTPTKIFLALASIFAGAALAEQGEYCLASFFAGLGLGCGYALILDLTDPNKNP